MGVPWKVSCPDVIIPPDPSMAAFCKLAGLDIENPPNSSDLIGHDLEKLDLRDSNDLITPLSAILALGDGGQITGAKHATYKESNRILRTRDLLEQFSKHGSIDLNLTCLGDLEIDEHHTVEDIAIALGTAINSALGDRIGISRYASSEILVMDEVKSNVSIDLSSRRYLDFKCSELRDYVGDFPTEMFEHFFVSLINAAAMTCHIETNGKNSHHLLEATFKTFARCLKSAIVVESIKASSTKGLL